VFAKLVVVVLALGACGCTLLAMRQSRLQLASELTQTQLRINHADERLWALRAQIAARVRPDEIERMAAEIGPLHQMTEPDRVAPRLRADLTKAKISPMVGPPVPPGFRFVTLTPEPVQTPPAKPSGSGSGKPAGKSSGRTPEPTRTASQGKSSKKSDAGAKATAKSTKKKSTPPRLAKQNAPTSEQDR
jgi:hypothetical protein